MAMTTGKQTVFDWIDQHRAEPSEQHLRCGTSRSPRGASIARPPTSSICCAKAGFEVEEGIATMPTAFSRRSAAAAGARLLRGVRRRARESPGAGAVPQAARRLHRSAAGHTDPHSALGVGAFGGRPAAKAAMEKHRLPGTLGSSASQPRRCAGRSRSTPPTATTTTSTPTSASAPPHSAPLQHDGVGHALRRLLEQNLHLRVHASGNVGGAMGASAGSRHTLARAPAAIDAVCLMYTTTKYTKEAMFPHTGTWTLNEFILVAGQATSDNLPPNLSQIQYSWRSPTLGHARSRSTPCSSATRSTSPRSRTAGSSAGSRRRASACPTTRWPT